MKTSARRTRLLSRLSLVIPTLLYLLIASPIAFRLDFNEFEIRNLSLAMKSPAHIVSDFFEGRLNKPPLFPLAQHLWAQMFGGDEIGLRLLNLLLGALCIPLVISLTRWTYGPRAAACAGFLAALSPYLLSWSWLASWYTMAACFFLLSCLALLRIESGHRRAWMLIHWASNTASLYTTYYAPALWVAQAGYLAFMPRGPRMKALLTLTLAAAAFAPWLGTTLREIAVPGELISLPESAGVPAAIAVAAYASLFGETLLPTHYAAVSGAAAAGMVLFCLAILAPPRKNLILTLLPFFLAQAGAAATQTLKTYRILPFAYLCVPFFAAGAAALWARKSLRLLCVALLLPAWGLSVFNLWTGREYSRPGFAIPWRSILTRWESASAPGDLLIHNSLVLEFYSKRTDSRRRAIRVEALPIGETVPENERLRNARRVWVLRETSAYTTHIESHFDPLLRHLNQSHSLVERRALVKDDWWPVKRRWAPALDAGPDRLVLYEYVRPIEGPSPHPSEGINRP